VDQSRNRAAQEGLRPLSRLKNGWFFRAFHAAESQFVATKNWRRVKELFATYLETSRVGPKMCRLVGLSLKEIYHDAPFSAP
jgi:hypothetical protein